MVFPSLLLSWLLLSTTICNLHTFVHSCLFMQSSSSSSSRDTNSNAATANMDFNAIRTPIEHKYNWNSATDCTVHTQFHWNIYFLVFVWPARAREREGAKRSQIDKMQCRNALRVLVGRTKRIYVNHCIPDMTSTIKLHNAYIWVSFVVSGIILPRPKTIK